MRHVGTAISLVVGLLLVACTTLVEELPETGAVASIPTAPVPIPIVVNPVPLPTPQDPAPTPTPDTGPTPAPTPAPTPPPAPTPAPNQSCTPGPGSGLNCPRTSPSFLGEVTAAIDTLGQQQPDLFNFNDQRGAGGWLVLDPVRYHWAVVEILNSRGLCATYDGEEIAVKNGNGFSDQYDIHLSSGHVRRGDGSYMATCTPAWF
jgi:hypothetical protein